MRATSDDKGFTLIELMIVVVIVGVLAMIAYPSYRDYMLRTHRSEGLAALQQAAARQERYFSNQSQYADSVGTLGVPASTESGYYAISIDDDPCGNIARCYTITATAQGEQAEDTGCTAIELDSTGSKTPADCW